MPKWQKLRNIKIEQSFITYFIICSLCTHTPLFIRTLSKQYVELTMSINNINLCQRINYNANQFALHKHWSLIMHL